MLHNVDPERFPLPYRETLLRVHVLTGTPGVCNPTFVED